MYRRLFGNRVLLALWGGQAISTVGDVFFNIAAMWVVYTQSHSTLQTAIIQAIWHLPSVLLGPFAGAWVDRWDRKRVMWVTNILAAAVVGVVAALLSRQGALSPLVIFGAVFLLNSLNTFFGPARFSIMPQVVGRDLLAAASGLFTTVRQAAYFLGAALAGGVIAVAGAAWAVASDAVSFLAAAVCILVVPLPARTTPVSTKKQRQSLWRELAAGWKAIGDQPVVQAMVWLNLLINVPSFLGPLMPALVSQRLHGGATAYGALEAVSVIGAAAGGAVAGLVDRRIGAGRMLAAGWGLAGACTVGMAASTVFPVTAALEAASAFVLTMGGVSMGALTQALVPEHYRGRVSGITRAMAVVTIPVSALLGGWLADQVGPAPLFAVGGAWILGCTGLAWSNRHVRMARIE